MNNLSGLIDRLENATFRLESLASSSVRHGPVTDTENGHQISPTTKTKDSPSGHLSSSELVNKYDELINGCLGAFVELSSNFGGVLHEQGLAVSRAFEAMKHFLILTTLSKQPDSNSKAYIEIIKDLQTEIGVVNELRESNQSSALKNHLSMVGEGVGALGWITIESSPAEYAAEFMQGAKLYGNRILKQFREKEKEDPHWVQAFYALCQSLVRYVRTNHPKGINWNKDGLEPEEALRRIKGGHHLDRSSSNKNVIAVPTPPPLPSTLSSHNNRETYMGSVNMRDVFKEINKGENITSTLKKVDRHREESKFQLSSGHNIPRVVANPSRFGPGGQAKSGNTKMPIAKAQKHVLDGNRWILEYFDHPEQPITVTPEIRQSILISHCHDASIIIPGKATAVSVDNCSRLSLSLDSLVASIELIKVNNLSLEISGTVSSILLDQIDIGNILVGKSSANIEIYTSKTTGVNISYKVESTEGENSSKEFLISEQIKSFFRDGKLISEVVAYIE